MICKALEAMNCTIEEAEDGLVAVEKVKQTLEVSFHRIQVAPILKKASSDKAVMTNDQGIGVTTTIEDAVVLRPAVDVSTAIKSTGSERMAIDVLSARGGRNDNSRSGNSASSIVHEGMQGMRSLVKSFDFIMCDNVMPNMDGPTATKTIRELGYKNPIFGECHRTQ
jgi:CheY-like chemotaxis protein